MNRPLIKSGKFHAGADLRCGENVVIDVADECIVGDRCVLPDNAYLGGRSVKLGDDFYGYSWEWRRLEVGRGRRDEEHAALTVGDRCTFHDNKIDLSAPVVIGDDVGLSPEVTIYTHHYWLSLLEGYPQRIDGVTIGNGVIVGYRSTVLAGARIGNNAVIGAQSVVNGMVVGGKVWGGNPLRMLKEEAKPYPSNIKSMLLKQWVEEYARTCIYRKLPAEMVYFDAGASYPLIKFRRLEINAQTGQAAGEEDEYTDDFRLWLFKRGVRAYTKRPFRALGRNP